MKTAAVIFDMDGVIFDSERMYIECYKEIAEKYHVDNVEEVCYKCVGVTSEKTVRILKDYYGEDFPVEEYYTEAGKVFKEKYEKNGLPMKPGVRELLSFLKENGIKTALASSTKTEVVKTELGDAGILDFFDEIVGGDMVQRSKPDPDIFLKAAEALGLSPEEVMVIEDSFNGIRAAYAAGMKAVMVPDLLQPDEEIRSKAYRVEKSLLDVRDYLSTGIAAAE
ncbi:MAG: HAD family phosphatase [Eubacterium sp.]|nr:HAD family phosphatase [Eubacterium sp.]